MTVMTVTEGIRETPGMEVEEVVMGEGIIEDIMMIVGLNTTKVSLLDLEQSGVMGRLPLLGLLLALPTTLCLLRPCLPAPQPMSRHQTR